MKVFTLLRRSTAWCATAMVALAATSLAVADETKADGDQAAKSPAEVSATTGGSSSSGSSGGGSSSSSSAPHAAILKDFKKQDGLIPTYHKGNRMFFELNSSHYNGEFIVLISIARGAGIDPLYGGMSWGFGDDWVWSFRKVDDRVHIVRKNVRFKAQDGKPESRAVKHAYNDSVLFSIPIATKGPGGGDLVEVTPVFMSDLPMIGDVLPGFGFSSSKSIFGEVKGFKENLELQVEATYQSSGRSSIDTVPDSRGLTIDVHYSISKIPSGGYTPRLADDRVGYFLTAVKNFSKSDDEQFVRYVNRWKLEKADPSAKMSEPKEPIIFYMENTIPYKYRKPIRDGILEWNKAFEKAGFIDAIHVRQQEDDADWDPEDVRYNTFRWITSDAGFAMGPSRVNPYTGQILDADIIFDADFLNYWKQAFENYNPQATEALLGGPLDVDSTEDFLKRVGSISPRHQCRLSGGMSQQFAFGAAAVLAQAEKEEVEKKKKKKKAKNKEEAKEEAKSDKEMKDDEKADKEEEASEEKADEEKKEESKEDDSKEEEEKKPSAEEVKKEREALLDRMIMEGLKEVAMHEVGHTLGLRHNFVASKYRSLEEIREMDNGAATVSSVMDYVPPHIAPPGEKQGAFFPQSIGVYDMWAIEYGYKPLNGSTDAEKGELNKIASKSTEDGLAYLTDEDTTSISPDPDSNRFDFGKDPLEFAKNQAEVVKAALDGLADRVVEEGEDYSRVRQAFNTLLNTHGQSMYFASRYIGGVHVNRSHKGQEDTPPFTVVDADKQREVMELISDQVFSDEPFQFSAELYNKLAPSHWNHWGTSFDVRGDYPIHETISRWQSTILSRMFSSITLERMHDAELKVPADQDAFTTAEMIESLTDAIFSELDSLEDGEYTVRQPAISSLRRNLQRDYLQRLSTLAMGNSFAPADCQTIAYAELMDLSNKLEELEEEELELDSYTRAHLLETKRRIDKVLDAELTLSRP
ncbi:zinc-dependent metalloprotease [Bremerella sp. T1]|uniref:zinc-dependent metalloprotease n=1 Tax=Bremerella sp. TYQ1 TaxID=3119568 RepID=UPI001CCBA59C|nr:zinc-dependent metalloprotease [Bremerella volcania]UBM36446.1 zinc-dependent metalloprotease [Bremerella volcania]